MFSPQKEMIIMWCGGGVSQHYGDNHIAIHNCIKLYTLNYTMLYVNYISVKLKKKEIRKSCHLQHMDDIMKDIMLSEINQTEKDKYYMISLIMWNLKKKKKKKSNSWKQRVEWWLPGTGESGKWGDASQRIQAFSYKMNKFWGSNVQHGDYSW